MARERDRGSKLWPERQKEPKWGEGGSRLTNIFGGKYPVLLVVKNTSLHFLVVSITHESIKLTFTTLHLAVYFNYSQTNTK